MSDMEWDSKLYSRVEDFLEWYATCREPGAEDCRVTSLSMPRWDGFMVGVST